MSPCIINPLNAELNPICHLLALLGRATIVVVSRLRVNVLYASKSCLLLEFFFNGRYIDYLSLAFATNKGIILKVTL